jgi:S1-C subfamily serine protease
VRDRNFNLREVPEGTGSGFIWDSEGHIVTNNHVIQGVTFGVSVTLADQSTYPAQVVEAFPEKDLAVLWIGAPKNKLRPIEVGTSGDLLVGQSAYAIGNPFGLDQSLTTGIVSALGRAIQTENSKRIQNAIQTSAPINPGNSGGPLLDSAGRLIGVNSAILSPSGGWAGVGFAIPVDEVNQVVSKAISQPRPLRAALGITLAPDTIRRQLGAPGPLVLDVLPGSAAEKAGLRPTRRTEDGDVQVGDALVSVGGDAVQSLQDIHQALARHKVGDQIAVVILRDGQRQTVKVTLGAAR